MKRTMIVISIFFVVSCGGNSIEQDSSQTIPQQMTSAPQNPSMKQEVDKQPAGKNCTLSGGEIVEDGWRGKGDYSMSIQRHEQPASVTVCEAGHRMLRYVVYHDQCGLL